MRRSSYQRVHPACDPTSENYEEDYRDEYADRDHGFTTLGASAFAAVPKALGGRPSGFLLWICSATGTVHTGVCTIGVRFLVHTFSQCTVLPAGLGQQIPQKRDPSLTVA